MTFSIDTDAASGLGLEWSASGTETTELQAEVERLLGGLEIGSTDRPATRSLATAGEQLWRIATAVLSAVDAAQVADHLDAASLTAQLQIAAPPSYSPIEGDLGDTFAVAVRAPYVIQGATDAAIGAQLVVKALLDTASNIAIRGDEFGIDQIGPNQYMLVLPGVTDLSRPDLGLSGVHRSPRDVDQSALRSFGNTSIDSNPYALSVVDAVRRAGVPAGAQIVIVGHSYGADTATWRRARSTALGATRSRMCWPAVTTPSRSSVMCPDAAPRCSCSGTSWTWWCKPSESPSG
jgi:hypothetical protein